MEAPRKNTAIVVIAFVLLIFITRDIFIVYFGRGTWKPWTGFGEYEGPDGLRYMAKTLWDWLDLLIVPVVLSIGALLFSRGERQNEQRIAKDKQREDLLQIYFDRMSDLLLKEDSKTFDIAFDAETIMRARTLAALSQLDGVRKGTLINFLTEAGLISSSLPRVLLKGAKLDHADFKKSNLAGANFEEVDLSYAVFDEALLYKTIFFQANLFKASFIDANLDSAVLIRANLEKSNLIRAELQKAWLSDALLRQANLHGAFLIEAELDNANLTDANLYAANLKNADLSGANLHGASFEYAYLLGAKLLNANLEEANLFQSKVTVEQLETAASLKGAKMPDGSIHV